MYIITCMSGNKASYGLVFCFVMYAAFVLMASFLCGMFGG